MTKTMKFIFDPNQEYQRDAVAAVADLFEGQGSGSAHVADPAALEE